MIGARTSTYTFERIDNLLKKHEYLRNLALSTRKSIMNSAIQKIWALRDEEETEKVIEALVGITITDNVAIYPDEKADNITIYTLGQDDLLAGRKSIYTVKAALDSYNRSPLLRDLSEENKLTIASLSQLLLSKLRNQNGIEGYGLDTNKYDRYAVRNSEYTGELTSYATVIARDVLASYSTGEFTSYATLVTRSRLSKKQTGELTSYATLTLKAILDPIEDDEEATTGEFTSYAITTVQGGTNDIIYKTGEFTSYAVLTLKALSTEDKTGEFTSYATLTVT